MEFKVTEIVLSLLVIGFFIALVKTTLVVDDGKMIFFFCPEWSVAQECSMA